MNFIRLCCEESDWVGLSSLPRRGEVIFSSSAAAQTAESTFIREQSLRTNNYAEGEKVFMDACTCAGPSRVYPVARRHRARRTPGTTRGP